MPTMWRTSLAVLLLLIYSSTALVEWQMEIVNLCEQRLELACSRSTELIIRQATFLPHLSQTPWDMRTIMMKSLWSVGVDCNGRDFCRHEVDRSVIELACGEPHVSVTVEVEYGCVPAVRLQRTCGGTEEQFVAAKQGFVVNHLYPSHSMDRRCTIIFKVEEEKEVTVRPMTLTLPAEWDATLCNLTHCHSVQDTDQHFTVTGNFFIRMAAKQGKRETTERLSFSFEYEVADPLSEITQQEDESAFDPNDIGVINVEERTQMAAIAAGVGVPTALVIILGFVYIYQSRHADKSDEKLVGDTQSESPFDPYYGEVTPYKPGQGMRLSWGNGCHRPSLSKGSSSI